MTDLSFLPNAVAEQQEERETTVVNFNPRQEDKSRLSFLPDKDSGFDRVQQNFNLSRDVNSNVAAKQYELAKQTGLSPALVSGNEEAVKTSLITRHVYNMPSSSPNTLDYFKNPGSVDISKDDITNLQNLERVFKNIKTSFQVGRQNVEGGKLFTDKVLHNITGLDNPELDQRIADFEAKQIQSPEDENFLETSLTGAAEMIPLIFETIRGGAQTGFQLATTLGLGALALGQAGPQAAIPEELITVPAAAATGYLVGSRAGAVNAIFQIETGLAYQEMKDIKDENGNLLDPVIASVAAVGIGSINAGLEFVGLNSIAKLIPGGQKVLGGIISSPVKEALKKESIRSALAAVGKKYVGAVGIETMTEMAQEVVNIFGTEIAKEVAEVTDDTLFQDIRLEEALPRIAEVGREAFAATIALGIPGVSVSAVKRINEVKDSVAFTERQTEISEAVNETNTKERSPGKMREFFEVNGFEEKGFLGAETVLEMFQTDVEGATKIFEKMDVDVKEAQESAEVGQDTEINLATLHSNLSEEEVNTLIPDLKPAPSAISQRELKGINFTEEIQNKADLYAEAFGDQQVFQDELQRVRAEAIEAGENKDVVEGNIRLMESFANRMSLEGQDRVEFIKKISVQGGVAQTDDISLKQLSDFPEANRLSNIDKEGAVWKTVMVENPELSSDIKVVKIYRATIGEKVRPGDFVAANKTVADQHLDNLKDRGEEGRLITKDVRVEDLKMGADATEFVYEPVSLKEPRVKKAARKVKEFFQPPRPGTPRGSVRISDERNLITLFGNRNFSTLLHETGHIYFNEFQQVASLPGASEQIKNDFDALRTWLDLKPGQDIGVKEQEQFARGFETWLIEGKAPTQELIPVFTRFKNWLLSVYQSATALNVDMTDEVRGVFNRMFTAKQQTVAAAQSNEMILWPKEQIDALGVVKDDQDFMKRLLDLSYEKAERAMVKDRNKSARSLQKTWKGLAEKHFEEAPNYVQARLMREGDGIDPIEIGDTYGEDLADIMKRKRIAKKDGISIDEATELSTYENPEEMFVGLINTQPKAYFIKAFIDEQRRAHDALFKAENYLSSTEEYSQFLEIKSKYLRRADGKPTELKPRQIFKQFARKWLDGQPVRDAVRVDRFMAAQAKYSRQESEALRKKNLGNAAKANELVRQNYELAKESIKNREEIGKLERLAKRLTKRDPKKLLPEYRNALYDVLLRFGLANPEKIKVEDDVNLSNLLDGNERVDPFFASQTLLYSKGKSYKDIQMIEAKDLRNLLKYLSIHGATPDEQVLRTGDKVVDISDAMAAESVGLSKKKVHEQGTLRRKLTNKVRNFYKNFDSFNFVMTSMGGYQSIGKDGTFSRTELETSQAIAEASDQRHTKMIELNKKVWPSYLQLLKSIDKLKKKHGDKITQNVPSTPSIMRQNGQTNWWRPEQILALALNVGNQSNKDRIFSGFQGFTELDLDRLLDFLTKEDWDAIQAVWDLNDEIFKEVNEVHYRVNGYKAEKIPALKVKTTFGDYRGGYSPIRYDTKMAENAGGVKDERIANLNEKADLMSRQESRFQTPATKSGFVKGRVGATPYPLLLSLEPIGDHISDTTHYVTHAEIMRDVDRLIRTDSFKDAVRDHLGVEVYKELRPALQYMANPRKVSQDPQMDGLFGKLRQMATTWTLAYNLNVAAKQFFSSPAAALKLGKRGWVGAYMKTVFDVPDIKNKYDFMLNNSAFMNARTNSFDQEFKKQFNSLNSQQKSIIFGDKLITWEDVVAVGFLPIKIVDMATVLPLWTAAYNQKMKRNGSLPEYHDDAVKFADEVIRTTQPSAQALDLTKAQRSSGLWQLFSMFGTFTIGKYQQRVRLNWRAFKSNKISTPKYLETVFLEQLLPAVGMATVMQLMKGADFDEEDTIETVAADALQSLATLPIPVLGSLLYPFSSYAFSLSPVENVAVAIQRPLQKTARELGKGNEEEAAKAAFWTIANLISIWKRVPVSKVVQKIEKSLED